MDPVSVALRVVEGIAGHATRAVANKEDCKLLASLAEQTKPFLHTLGQQPVDNPSLQAALDLVFDALGEADRVIETCCKSTYLTAMFCARTNSDALKHAAHKLEHALQQVPLASLPVAGEMHECINALADDLRRAKFDSAAASTHQTRILKEEMEKAFNKNLKGTEEMKSIIVDMMKEHSISVEARLQDLDVLKDYIHQARKDKDRQQEFELQQIIDVISESIQQNEAAPSSDLSEAVLDQLRCPISLDFMKDPVVLKDSGVTYERANIVKWLGKGHREDPMTKIEIRSGELIPNRLVKSIVSSAFGTEGAAEQQTEKEEEPSLEAGLYEGHGQHKRADGTVESAYLLICLDPDGNVQGCVMTEAKDSDAEQQFLIVEGKWEASNPRLCFTSPESKYEGTLSIAASTQRAFRFVGKTTPLKDAFSSSSFMYPQLGPPPLQYLFLLRSELLEMQGIITNANGKEFRSKMLLSLNKDSSLRGWSSIDDSARSIRVGSVLSGGWELNGTMHLSLYFPRSENEPLDSPFSPSNFLAHYKLDGDLRVEDNDGHRQGITYEGIWRLVARGEDAAFDTMYPKMISGLESFGRYNYHCFRTPSRRISIPLQNNIRPLRLPSEPGEHTAVSRLLSYLYVAVRIIDPGLKRFRAMGQVLTSHMNRSLRDVRDASTAYACWHSGSQFVLTLSLEAADRPNEFFIKIHTQRCTNPNEPRAGSYLTVLPRTSYEETKDTHYCCFALPERSPLFQCHVITLFDCFVLTVSIEHVCGDWSTLETMSMPLLPSTTMRLLHSSLDPCSLLRK